MTAPDHLLDYARWSVARGRDRLLPATTRAVEIASADALCAIVVGRSLPDLAVFGHILAGPIEPYGPTLRAIAHSVASIRATEADDIELLSCTTPGSVVVAVACGLALSGVPIDAQAIAPAIVAGYDAMIALGRRLDGPIRIADGIWPTYACAPFAAAATVSSLLALNEAKTASALAIALCRSAARNAKPAAGYTPRWHLLAAAAIDGVMAAQAAYNGLSASGAILDTYLGSLGAEPGPLVMPAESLIMRTEIKPFPAARQAIGAITAMREIAIAHSTKGIPAKIELYVPGQHRAMLMRGGKGADRVGLMTNVAHQIALAWIAPEALYDVNRLQYRDDARVSAIAANVRVEMSEEATRLYPTIWTGALRITLQDGAVHERNLAEPVGRSMPVTFDNLTEKYRAIAASSGGIDKAAFNTCLRYAEAPGESANSAAMRDLFFALSPD